MSVKDDAISVLGKIKDKCSSVGLKYETTDLDDNIEVHKVYLPNGEKFRPISFTLVNDDSEFTTTTLKRSQAFLAIDFENYGLVEDFEAVYTKDFRYFEAKITNVRGVFRTTWDMIASRLDKTLKDKKPLYRERQTSYGIISIEMGKESKECSALVGRNLQSIEPATIKVKGIKAIDYDEAVSLFNDISNAFLFQIESALDYHLAIQRTQEPRNIRFTKESSTKTISFPSQKYNVEPLSYYRYGISAANLPLLRYLAYYQVFEFYFPKYSKLQAIKTVRNILKEPGFNIFEDFDINKILLSIKVAPRGAYGSEKEQLYSVLKECVNPNLLKVFIENEQLTNYFKKEGKKLSKYELFGIEDNDKLIQNLANRIYDIRCRIVHSKDQISEEVSQPLFPYSKEERQIRNEIVLIEQLAKWVIVASSDEMTL